MAKNKSSFQTIRTEGALFPPDILQRIASLKVDGTRLDDYHLPPGFKVKEAITASWNSLRAHWSNFQEARESLDADNTGTAITNDRWLLPLFKELDFGRLTTDKAPVIDEKSYPIERFYNHTPIHLIGCNLPLDRRTKGARGAATASPHSMMQEFLNRSDDHLWAFVSNGRQLRILRDNISLSRQAFVEFDLEAMMDGEVYSDFALMWLLCHQSRVEADQPEQCWLETWSGLAREQGTRILKDLRGGVEKSIEALGQGFISHPRNDGLRYKLQHGKLTKDDYYRQLLRIVYRLLFLFVAEDRELLHPTNVDPEAAELYDTYYSTRRLREMAERIRGSKHADLWHSLSLVFDSLGNDEGCPQLGLIGLGSFLWRTESTTDLNGPISISRMAQARGSQTHGSQEDDVEHPSAPVYISNDDLLLSIRALAYVEQDKVLRSVDYRNLGSEELGSVYESLLELHPQMHVEAKMFSLGTAAGNERKTTGSYYTPDSLVQCLLDSALEPVVEQRLKEAKQISRSKITLPSGGSDAVAAGEGTRDQPDWIDRIPPDRKDVLTSGNYIQIAEQAILALTVCDPACGSGHFLIAAAHRLARHLARVRTGESEPSPADHQHALRDVIGRCIYGVDINPMAVELCKVSLWMEAIEPGKPLSFLDYHIQCGNSLLGTTPKILANGIPNEAFKPIEGDDPDVCRDLKRKNSNERTDAEHGGIQQELWERKDGIKLGNMTETFAKLSAGDDDTVEAIRQKELEYTTAIRGDKYRYSCLLSDLWCASFFWRKDESDLGRLCPTQYYLKQVEQNLFSVPKAMEREVRRIAKSRRFFHWNLAFPDVLRPTTENAEGVESGFDLMLGNPPWIRQEELRQIKGFLQCFYTFSSTADLSVYFTELSARLLASEGFAAILTPNKWFRAGYGKQLRKFLRKTIVPELVIDFGHAHGLFGDADTFPAALVFSNKPTMGDQETFPFVDARDELRNAKGLVNLIRDDLIAVPVSNLKERSWTFDSVDVSALVSKISGVGNALKESLGIAPKYGIKTGLNEAFYIDAFLAEEIRVNEPDSAAMIRPFVRGRDLCRWRISWDKQYHIVIASSNNRDWAWSSAKDEKQAEVIFAANHPIVHNHLKQHEKKLRNRSDQGVFWWELRSCEYYEAFDRPKIVVSRIAYHSEIAIDESGYFQNDSTVFIPSDDNFILAILNSPIMWWYMTRTFPHKKDEAISMDVDYLARLPIPEVTGDLRRSIESAVSDLRRESNETTFKISRENELMTLVSQCYGLSESDLEVIAKNPVPRDPLGRLRKQLDADLKGSIARDDVVSDIMLLLNQWATAVHVNAIELGVLFMCDDRSRQIISDEKPIADLPDSTQKSSDVTHLITQFDLLYYEMAQGGLIEPVGENAYQIKDKSAVDGFSNENFERAREAVEAVSKFDRPDKIIEKLRRGNVSVTFNV